MDTILVTGSQGFIGSYICQDLLDNGYRVIGIDDFSKYGVVSRPHDNHKNFSLIVADVRNIDSVPLDEKIDYIIAGAAMIGGIQYFHEFAYDLLAANEGILISTFNFAIKKFKEGFLKKIIVLSSSMVFESSSEYPTPESAILTSPPPMSTYGFQKLSSEYFCKGAWEQYKLPYTIIRPFNCIGVGEDKALVETKMTQGNIEMQMSHVVPDLIHKCLVLKDDQSLPILGSGNQIRHYTYGKDIARGIRLSITNPNALNNDFNISSDEALSVIDLASIIWKKIHPDREMTIEHCEPMKYDVQIRSPSTTKAKDLLGFTCDYDVSSVIDEIISWVKNSYLKMNTQGVVQ